MKKPSLFKNAFSNWVSLCVNIAIAFLLTPFIISSVGKDGYGIWTLVLSFIGYFGLLQLGVSAGIMRYIPYYSGKKENFHATGIFSSAFAFYVFVGTVIFSISFFFAPAIATFFGKGNDFIALVRLVGVASAIHCPAAVLDASLRSKEGFVLANCLAVFLAITKAIGLVVVLTLGYGIVGMGWIVLIQSIAGYCLYWATLKLAFPALSLSVRYIKYCYFKDLLMFGLLAAVMSLGFMLRFNSDRVIIGRVLDMEAVGIYGLAAALMLKYRNAIGAVSRVLQPRFGVLDGQNNKELMKDLFYRGTKTVAFVAVFIGGVLFALGPAFIQLWVGSGFEQAYPVLLVLVIAQIIDQSQTPTISLLTGSGKQGFLAGLAIAEGLSGIFLAMLLYRYGLLGIAIGFAIPMIIAQLFVRPVYVCSFLNIRLRNYFKKCLLGLWGCGMLVFVPFRFIQPELYIDSWLSFLFAFSLLCILFLAVAGSIAFTKQERARALKRFSHSGPIRFIMPTR